jgi:hypothetical protein
VLSGVEDEGVGGYSLTSKKRRSNSDQTSGKPEFHGFDEMENSEKERKSVRINGGILKESNSSYRDRPSTIMQTPAPPLVPPTYPPMNNSSPPSSMNNVNTIGKKKEHESLFNKIAKRFKRNRNKSSGQQPIRYPNYYPDNNNNTNMSSQNTINSY